MAIMPAASTVPAYDLRISIEDTVPPVWRTVRLPESLTIPQFHMALQAAFGWEDRHAYAITCVDGTGKRRQIIGPDDATEDLDAEPASGVVLSELLRGREAGATLEYEYDFGDSWTHHVELLGHTEIAAGEMLCLDGDNRGPVEDSGGAHGYQQLIQVLEDPSHPQYQDARMWLFDVVGIRFGRFNPAAFDQDAANANLYLLSRQWWPQPLTDEEREAVVRPIRWFLEIAEPDGIELTSAGYLKPALVKRAMDELGWSDPIMGKGNRENHARPVAELRQRLVDWKFLRKLKGRLVLTVRGKRVLQRPEELWGWLLELIGRPDHDAVRMATHLYVHWYLSPAGPPQLRTAEVLQDALVAAGFVTRSGDPIPRSWAVDIDQTAMWNLAAVNLAAAGQEARLPWALPEQSRLSDGGVKFLLEILSRA